MACFLAWWQAVRPDVGLAPVRARHLADHLVAESERGMAPSTIYAEVNGLRIFFAWLVAEEHLAADPSATLRPPRRNPNRVDVYSPADAATILAHRATDHEQLADQTALSQRVAKRGEEHPDLLSGEEITGITVPDGHYSCPRE